MNNNHLTDKANIPEKGERLNQTILEIGKSKSWNQKTGAKEPAIIAKTIVDSGPRAKKDLSCPFFYSEWRDLRHNEKFREFASSIDVVIPKAASSLEAFLSPFQEVCRNARFSALVSPVEFETEKGRYVRYEQTFFTTPQNERQINIVTEPTQFYR